jgi:hypothetical protein
MAELKVNFAGVPDQKSFEPVPAGRYMLELSDYIEDEVSQGENEGQPLYKLTWEVLSDDEDLNGRKIWDNLTIMDTTLWRLKAMLKGFGFVIDDSEDAEELAFEFDELLGKTLEAQVSISPKRKNKRTGEEYQPRNKISKFIIPGEDDD